MQRKTIITDHQLYATVDGIYVAYSGLAANLSKYAVPDYIVKITHDAKMAFAKYIIDLMRDLPITDGYRLLIIQDSLSDTESTRVNRYTFIWHGLGVLYTDWSTVSIDGVDSIFNRYAHSVSDIIRLATSFKSRLDGGACINVEPFEYDIDREATIDIDKLTKDKLEEKERLLNGEALCTLIDIRSRKLIDTVSVKCLPCYNNNDKTALLKLYLIHRMRKHRKELLDTNIIVGTSRDSFDDIPTNIPSINNLLSNLKRAKKSVDTYAVQYKRLNSFKKDLADFIAQKITHHDNFDLVSSCYNIPLPIEDYNGYSKDRASIDFFREIEPILSLYPELICLKEKSIRIDTPWRKLNRTISSIANAYKTIVTLATIKSKPTKICKRTIDGIFVADADITSAFMQFMFSSEKTEFYDNENIKLDYHSDYILSELCNDAAGKAVSLQTMPIDIDVPENPTTNNPFEKQACEPISPNEMDKYFCEYEHNYIQTAFKHLREFASQIKEIIATYYDCKMHTFIIEMTLHDEYETMSEKQLSSEISNKILAVINTCINDYFATPDKPEFASYLDTLSTFLDNTMKSVTKIKTMLLSSNDVGFIDYLYGKRCILKKERDARIKEIEDANIQPVEHDPATNAIRLNEAINKIVNAHTIASKEKELITAS